MKSSLALFYTAFIIIRHSENQKIMKLRDFILPKISRSNPQVRQEAVRRENNMSLLQQISKQDKDPEVRQLALKRLKKLATSQMFREKMRS